jgi:hypothetical protein
LHLAVGLGDREPGRGDTLEASRGGGARARGEQVGEMGHWSLAPHAGIPSIPPSTARLSPSRLQVPCPQTLGLPLPPIHAPTWTLATLNPTQPDVLGARGRETAGDWMTGSRPVALARCAAVAPRRSRGWTTRPGCWLAITVDSMGQCLNASMARWISRRRQGEAAAQPADAGMRGWQGRQRASSTSRQSHDGQPCPRHNPCLSAASRPSMSEYQMD